jgi:hypothetical protein
MTTIVAIDPGASGGIAWCVPGQKPCCVPMPQTEGDLIAQIKLVKGHSFKHGIYTVPAESTIFYLEDLVRFMGKTPMSHMAVYASNWGLIKGAIMYSGSPLHIVTPKAWMKSLGVGVPDRDRPRTEWKNKLKARAQQLYPHLEITLKTADALLLLEYAIKEQRNGRQD